MLCLTLHTAGGWDVLSIRRKNALTTYESHSYIYHRTVNFVSTKHPTMPSPPASPGPSGAGGSVSSGGGFTSGFRYHVWDPPLLLLQMLALQASFYACAGLCLAATAHAVQAELSLDLIFAEQVGGGRSGGAERGAALVRKNGIWRMGYAILLYLSHNIEHRHSSIAVLVRRALTPCLPPCFNAFT